jgi:hypothetical protein
LTSRLFLAEHGGDRRVIEPDFLLDNASITDGVKIEPAWPLNGDEVSAAVIIKRYMQGLMNIAHPMAEALEKTELVASRRD